MTDPARTRLLVPLTYGLSVRYAVPTGLLELLADVATPVVGLGWDDPELVAVLVDRGLEVVRLPDARIDDEYRRALRKLALIHERRLASPTSAIRRRRWSPGLLEKKRVVSDVRNTKDRLAVWRSGSEERLLAEEAALLRSATNLADFAALLTETHVSGVLSLTPYHDQDALLLHSAQRAGLRTLVSVISFDNPTIRGRLPVVPDLVAVWNRENADQIARSHPGIDLADVEVVGAPQFDLHRQQWRVEPEQAWRERLGLPADRPVILYGAGPSRLVPDEHRVVEVLDHAIESGRLPGRPFILVRRHPADTDHVWGPHRGRFRHAVLCDPWASKDGPGRSWPTDEDLVVQMSSLAHSAVHVNVASSMTVDGSMFDRPQVGPAFLPGADRRRVRAIEDFYRQEHWEPIARSGGLSVVTDGDGLIDAVSAGLEAPGEHQTGRARLVESILTWTDGASSRRLVDAVGRVLSDTPAHPRCGPG